MKNTFLSILKGDTLEGEASISLKSCVPIFIAFPELLNGSNKTLSSVVSFYRPTVDYTEEGVPVDVGQSETVLLSAFNHVLKEIIQNSVSTELPALHVNVDIGYGPTVYGTVSPDLTRLPQLSHKHFCEGLGLSFNLAMQRRPSLSDNQKHNILLLQALTKRCSESNIWR